MKSKLIILAALMCLLCFSQELAGQTRKKSTSRSSTEKFSDRLWVGGSFNNNLRFGGGTFSFGLTPAAGYYMAPGFSIGTFLRFDYFYERIPYGQNTFLRYSSIDLGPGVFARYEILGQFFAQLEYERAFLQRAQEDGFGGIIVDNGKVVKETVQQNYVYIGAGYMGGQYTKFGISIHYNILDDFETLRFPWDYRFNVVVPIGRGGRS